MSDQLATERATCPCCRGRTAHAVWDLDGNTQIGTFDCCHCDGTGCIKTEPESQEHAIATFTKVAAREEVHRLLREAGRCPKIESYADEKRSEESARDATFRSGYATAVREFAVNARNHPLLRAKRKKAAALKRRRKTKSVPRAKSRRTKGRR